MVSTVLVYCLAFQVHPTKIGSIVNLYEASLFVKAYIPTKDPQSTDITALVSGCRFVENERGLAFVGPYKNLTVRDCLFENNRATHNGAGFLVLVSNETTVDVDNCTFIGNEAGQFRDHYAVDVEPNETVASVGDEVHINTNCCKGVVMKVGKGGAMRIPRGKVNITNSRFIGNTATVLGGSIFVDIDGRLKISNCYFENAALTGGRGKEGSHHSQQGDVIYSDGRLNIESVRIVAVSSINGLSIIRHSGDHWSVAINDIWIQCPTGFDLRTTNSTAYNIVGQGLRRSHRLDQISYFCESCPRNRYSLDFGYLNYTAVYHDQIYYTLLINGSRPTQPFTGIYEHHKITCLDCPHGGQCNEGIVPVANFWGYIMNPRGDFIDTSNLERFLPLSNPEDRLLAVKFQHCPKGYCRSTGPALTIDSCAELRYGRLCGRCRAGYSEAWFTTRCVSNDSCFPRWLFPLTVSLGLVYSAFLVYQADIKQFIFAGGRRSNVEHAEQVRVSKPRFRRRLYDDVRESRDSSREQVQLKPVDTFTTDADNCLTCQNTTTPSHQMTGNNSSLGLSGEEENDNHNGVVRPEDHHIQQHNQQQQQQPSLGVQIGEAIAPAIDYGCIVTLVYYLQDGLLLRVRTVFEQDETEALHIARSVIAGLFRFEMDIVYLLHRVCVVPDMTPVPKMLSQALLIPFIMTVMGMVYISNKLVAMCSRDVHIRGENRLTPQQLRAQKLTCKLVSGFISTLLFMYQKIGTTTFTLLNCVPIGDQKV